MKLRTILLVAVSLAGWTALSLPAPAAPTRDGAVTVGDPTHPAALRDTILEAYNNGVKRIVIRPGHYLIPPGADRASLAFHELSDCEISAYRVDLAFRVTGKDAVGFYNCRNVVFKGATVRYGAPQTGQAIITLTGRDTIGNIYEIYPEGGFSFKANYLAAFVMDATSRRFKPNTGDLTAMSVGEIGTSRLWRIHWRGDVGLPENGWNVRDGDYLSCRGGGGTMVHADGCVRCSFMDLNLFWGGAAGFLDTAGDANSFLHDTIGCGPVPPGGIHTPLLSLSGDGFRSTGARRGPDIEYCAFSSMAGNGIAIDGRYDQVASSGGTDLIVGTAADQPSFRAGDPVHVQNDSAHFAADATVKEVAVADFTPAVGSPIAGQALHYYLLTLDQALIAPAGSFATNPAASGAGYKIVHCKITNIHGHGLILMGGSGTEVKNVVEGGAVRKQAAQAHAP